MGFVRGERTVKKLRLSKALTSPEGTTVSEACRRMAARRVDAVLLTDVNGLLSGFVTDKVICCFLESSFDDCAGCRLVSVRSLNGRIL